MRVADNRVRARVEQTTRCWIVWTIICVAIIRPAVESVKEKEEEKEGGNRWQSLPVSIHVRLPFGRRMGVVSPRRWWWWWRIIAEVDEEEMVWTDWIESSTKSRIEGKVKEDTEDRPRS